MAATTPASADSVEQRRIKTTSAHRGIQPPRGGVMPTHAMEIRAVVDYGDDALRSELDSWGPETRATLARALTKVG